MQLHLKKAIGFAFSFMRSVCNFAHQFKGHDPLIMGIVEADDHQVGKCGTFFKPLGNHVY